MTSLLTVDDHDAVRAWACDTLPGKGFQVVAVATDGESTIEAARVPHRHVLLGARLPDTTGLEVIERLAGLATGLAPHLQEGT